ncbi:MAG: 3-keto-disaccharide hydrolase, partial [Sphingobacterium sp.]
VIEDTNINATYHSGPEYQLLDDAHVDFDKPLKRSGCLYTFAPQKNFVNTKPRTEWNKSRVVQKDGKVTFYLNDVMTAEADFNTPEWKEQIKRSGFKDYPEFGKNTQGQIALQDWSRGVTFRNLKIKQL